METYSLFSQFRECIHYNTKDNVQSNGGNNNEERQIKY